MISRETLDSQLEKIKFNPNGWGRTEARELCNILMPDEEIEECVNGYYDAGFALLVATKHRVLLVDKKPLNYLTVEDMRFDMISEFDYSHRLVGAHVCINSNSKTFNFTSLNKVRLRNLITYVQYRMTEMKKTMHEQQENQQQHLEQMNAQLREYLVTAQRQTLMQQQAAQAQAEQMSQLAAPVQAPYSPPQPVYRPSLTPDSASSFEKAAAVSMGLSEPVYYEVSGRSADNQIPTPVPTEAAPAPLSPLKRIVMTPQQIGLAATRRVVPVATAYSKLPFRRNRNRGTRYDPADKSAAAGTP